MIKNNLTCDLCVKYNQSDMVLGLSHLFGEKGIKFEELDKLFNVCFMSSAKPTPQKILQVKAYHMGVTSKITFICESNHNPEIAPTKCGFF